MRPIKSIVWFSICLLLLFFSGSEDKRYKKSYYDNGTLKSEGWMRFNVKTDYWKFYHPNGKLSEQGYFAYDKKEKYWFFYDENRIRTQQGAYKKNERTGWWIFYDTKGRVNHKCQLTNGIEDGYCLKYKDEKLISAEKFSKGKKIKEWKNFNSFMQENSLSDLK